MKSLKSQLLFLFLVFVLTSILTAVFTTYYFNRKEGISNTTKWVTDLEITLLKGLKEQENYFNFETSNNNYFKSGKSFYLDNYSVIQGDIEEKLISIRENIIDERTQATVFEIQSELKEFNALFQQMVLSIQKRGFKNYGIEGEMRKAIHELEEIKELKLQQILMLRRHEKDFIIRQDSTYLRKHDEGIAVLKREIEDNKQFAEDRKREILFTLQRYSMLFDQVATYDRMIGLKSNTGFKFKLNGLSTSLLVNTSKLKQLINDHQERMMIRLNTILFSFWTLYIIGVILLSFKMASKFTERLKTLSTKINYFVNTNFASRLELVPRNQKDEVGKLWDNVIKMEQEIIDYIELFKEKVDEKTLELSYKNEKIEIQKEELQLKKEESDQRNKELLDGMRYGWRIQRALLPTTTKLNKQLKDCFIFFVPKDIVSGDVYWSHREKSRKEEECIFSVVDCTGHGVPGAFMSILAISAINYSVLNKGHREPARILEGTNNYVFNSMKYYNSSFNDYHVKDGMDMLICKLNRKQNILSYSAGNRPLYLVRQFDDDDSLKIGLSEGEYKVAELAGAVVFEVFPTKKTVGTLSEKDSNQFESKEIQVKKGDMLYLTSDGYADQFGGPKNKKFMINRMKNVFTLIFNLDLAEQKNIIQQSFLDWKGGEEQIDDITILGVRV